MHRFIIVIIDEHTVLGKSHLNLDETLRARADGTDARLLLVEAAINGVVDEVELKLLPALDDMMMVSNGSDPDDGEFGNCVDDVGNEKSSSSGGEDSDGGGGEQRRMGCSASSS